MFGFAVRLRRKGPVKVVEKKSSTGAKLVAMGFLFTFFGAIFLFFEVVGKCHCKMDVIGGGMLSIGMFLLTTKCIADLCQSLMNSDDDSVDAETAADDLDDTYSTYSRDMTQSIDANLNQIFSLYKPMLISKEVSPANCDVKLQGKEQMKVFKCAPKLNTRQLRENTYNLPAVVVDT